MGDRVSSDEGGTLIVNALSARRGGGLMVCRAILSDLSAYRTRWRFVVVANGPTAVAELSELASDRLKVIAVNPRLGRISAYVQRFIIKREVRRHGARAIINQNFHIGDCGVPQVVLHVNVFNFIRNAELRGLQRVKERFRHRAATAALARARANVFESRYLMKLASRHAHFDESTSSVVHIGVDLPGDESLGISESERPLTRIVVITSDNPHKRNHWLAPIAAGLRDRLPDAGLRVVLYGAGEWLALKALTDRAGVADMFEYRGYVSGSRLGEELYGSLCLVSTSSAESFCSVAVEAMARGVPAVVPNVSSMPESVGTAGRVVEEEGYVDGFVREIERLYLDAEHRQAVTKAGLVHASTLGWRNGIAALSNVLDRALTDAPVVRAGR